MTMPKEKKLIQKEDIMPLDVYTKQRKELRKSIVEFKKNRRVPLGPYATFYFESYETMLAQVQEMLYIEKGGDEQLRDELEAYNPLIPNGSELVATFMFEIDNPLTRKKVLSSLGNVENKTYIKVNGNKIFAVPENDVDRTDNSGKTSSVHFLHFKFEDHHVRDFKDMDCTVEIGTDHEQYPHISVLTNEVKTALIKDFD